MSAPNALSEAPSIEDQKTMLKKLMGEGCSTGPTSRVQTGGFGGWGNSRIQGYAFMGLNCCSGLREMTRKGLEALVNQTVLTCYCLSSWRALVTTAGKRPPNPTPKLEPLNGYCIPGSVMHMESEISDAQAVRFMRRAPYAAIASVES